MLVVSTLALLLLAPLAPSSDAVGREDPVAEVKEELRDLVQEVNRANRDRDWAALERLYVPEFRYVHAFGFALDRALYIEEILEREIPYVVPVPTFEPPAELHLYGDAALYRFPGRTRAGTATFAMVLYVRRDGRWKIAQIQATQVMPERPAIRLDPAALDAYLGRYDGGQELFVVIAREGDSLVARHPKFPNRVLTPTAADEFYDKVGGQWTFHRDAEGQVTHFVRRLGGEERRWARVE